MTKDAVLAILRRESGYVSGEKISAALGVSRAAIHSAVNALRLEGCEISSATNKGYRLERAPDRMTTGDLLAYLPEARMNSVVCLDATDSTNKRLRDMAFEGAPDGQIVLANEQTSGRGRLGRSFASPRDRGIYLSALFRPTGLPADVVSITAWTAVAICRAIQSVCGVQPGIKWVNDLALNRRKVCGILTELSVESESGRIQHVIIGAGVNVNEAETEFPAEIRPIATSLLAETGRTFPRARLAAEMILEMDKLRGAWPTQQAEYLAAYRANSVTVGQEVRVQSASGERIGQAIAINDDFSLAVKYRDGETENLSSGEVSVRGLYGYA